jgi:signal transduction histidine kinase
MPRSGGAPSRRFAVQAIDWRPTVVSWLGRRRSVRFRVTGLATLLVAIVLVVVAVALLLVQHRALTAAVDDGLRRRADDLAAVVAVAVPATLAGSGDDDAGQLVTPTGEVAASSGNLAGFGPIAPDPGSVETIRTLRIAGPDDDFRVLSRSVQSPAGRLVLHVATAADDIADSVAVLQTSLLIAIPIALVVLALVAWWLVGRALQPVEAIRSRVAAVDETDLASRVPVPDSGDEIARLAETMNEMLDRIEGGIAALQRFVADASHELRSPLTRMRSELEVDLANLNGANSAATLRSVLAEVIALQTLVEDLLYLARSDAGRQPMQAETVDVDDLLLEEVGRLQSSNRLTVDVSQVSAGQVMGDRSQLRRLVHNLTDNAARHAVSRVGLGLTESGDWVEIRIEDDGPGIAPDQRERVFDRFARTDESRSRDDGGSGLGLAIVRDIASRHGGEVSVDPAYAAGARFVVRLPRPLDQR